MFKLIGIRNVRWNSSQSEIISANDGIQGFVVSRFIEKHGRPVCFIYKESRNFRDGDDIYLNKIIAKKSINFKMLSSGFAYPTFYGSFFYNLRDLFSDETKKARKAGRGLWSNDVTNKPFEISQLSDITENYILFPKLFRRLTSYIKDHGRFNAHEFIEYLEKKPEKVFILNFLHFTHFDNLVTVNKQGKIRLKYKPENLVFLD